MIDKKKCTDCGTCVPYCPVEAIHFKRNIHFIDQEECVECGVCLRSGVCKNSALYQPHLRWPRTLRSFFSDPLTAHSQTDIPGRGTEEAKTNDVTHRFKSGELGVVLELGRPGLGTSFEEVETVTKSLSALNARFEPKNPITFLIETETGKLRDATIAKERILSAVIEFTIAEKDFLQIAEKVNEVSGTINTVMSVGVATVCKNNRIPISMLRKSGFRPRINGKVNLGLALAWSYK
jgi:NAD-dependent dihydropyrimidine dehydrogenase PreA subunit